MKNDVRVAVEEGAKLLAWNVFEFEFLKTLDEEIICVRRRSTLTFIRQISRPRFLPAFSNFGSMRRFVDIASTVFGLKIDNQTEISSCRRNRMNTKRV